VDRPQTIPMIENNTIRNKLHYDHTYAGVDVESIINRVRNVQPFLADATKTDTSWYGLYYGNLQSRLKGRRVLELGAGDGLNALVMAALGAHVTAIDISEVTPNIVASVCREVTLEGSISALAGDFLAMNGFDDNSFDLVVGKAFLHHLDHETEAHFLNKIARLLKPEGEARFFEPAVNSALLDALRWMIPVPGRPSSFSPAFQEWKANDPHPIRDNSSLHYAKAVLNAFENVEILCIGSLERLHRLLPRGPFNRKFRRAMFRAERRLPSLVGAKLARSQVVIGRVPRESRFTPHR
jgi:ubiquinone/menaquinone biosynthesis C-methylase UbiE